MTHPIYTRDLLKNFSRGELYEICDRLSIPHRRSKEDCITDILAAQPQVVAQAELEVEQPANLPQVNDTHFIGGFLLRCAQVNSEYAVVWDVLDAHNTVMGEARMGWDCFWTHSMSLDTFATPQEAVVDLRQSLQAFAQEDEAVAFEKVANGKWEAMVNGVLVRITLEGSEYKSNLTDTVFADYDLAVVGSLVAAARVQEERLLERTERAKTIEVIEHCGDEFVVVNSLNGNHYIVCPNTSEVNQRCECADCRHRGTKCKHQIAVENFLKPSLVEQVAFEEDRKNLILYSYEKNSFVAYNAGVEVRQATIKTLLDRQFYLMDNDDVVGEFQIICRVA
ncbi:hypothetical protein NIES4072_31030 [Nostoc commune NIES-4072]|uniref:SWIM-type domain-containing protein n=1 Tax=Nostoc commune NIES-4072 TaxID=2005467 RepID=A0A2R5FMD1_NOSCO|nr:hypothetical protein [Nostoc commune]BBD69563.1 hypothetical protein NIES4070_59720 [Nostoc commune HK-02]GBG19435.1 hypothetical protein NIES4072_31030 [Nostoc commune NIES-4072]